MKICSACKECKSTDQFHQRRASIDGLAYICRDCSKQNARALYLSKTAEFKEKAKAWAEANPDRRKEIRIRSANKHIEKRRADGIEYHRRKRLTDIDAVRAAGRRNTAIRRAREAQNGGSISQEMWDALFGLFEFNSCLYCGEKDCNMVMDHFVPVRLGGRTEAGNLLPCCQICNASKRAKHPKDWLTESSYTAIVEFLELTREVDQETAGVAA